MSKLFKVFLSEIQKTQTRCGGGLFLASLLFWFIILLVISGYVYQKDADQFHCQTLGDHIPLNKTLQSKCYGEYSKTYNNPNFGRFALVNGLTLLISWAVNSLLKSFIGSAMREAARRQLQLLTKPERPSHRLP